MINLSKIKSQSGQSIVEAVVAITALTIAFAGILALINRSFALNQVITDQNIATYLAVEGIEVVRNLTDGNIIQSRDFNDNFNSGSFEVSYLTVLEADDTFADLDNKDPGLYLGGIGQESNTPLKFDSYDGYNYDAVSPTNRETRFIRTIKIMPPVGPGTDNIHVQSIVKWITKGSQSSEVMMEAYIFEPPTP